jgi:DNA invertase Pin-like site-specific DNA recombinase
MLAVLGGLAEFESELIRARTGEGRDRAKARGVKMGRKPKLTDHQKREAISAAIMARKRLGRLAAAITFPARRFPDRAERIEFYLFIRRACVPARLDVRHRRSGKFANLFCAERLGARSPSLAMCLILRPAPFNR